MKPISLCLVQMGQKGLELVRAYPEVLIQDEVNNIVLKSIPMGSRDGDFTTSTVGENVISGYIFGVPGEERRNIASLIAVFSSMEYEQKIVKKVFSFTVEELQKNNSISIDVISQILPKLYDGLVKGKLEIKISSITSLNLEITSSQSEKQKKDHFDSFGEDVWG